MTALFACCAAIHSRSFVISSRLRISRNILTGIAATGVALCQVAYTEQDNGRCRCTGMLVCTVYNARSPAPFPSSRGSRGTRLAASRNILKIRVHIAGPRSLENE